MRIASGPVQGRGVEGVQPRQRPEGVEPAQGIRRGPDSFLQERNGSRVLALDEQPLGRVAPPADRMIQQATSSWELAVFSLGRAIGGPGSCAATSLLPDPPDPPPVVPAAEVDAGAQVLGHELGMLDQLAVHVDDVEGPVRTGRQVDRPEGRVGRGQELPARLDPPGQEGAVRPARARGGAPGSSAARRRRHCRDRSGGKQVAALDHRPAAGVEEGDRLAIEPRLDGLMERSGRRRPRRGSRRPTRSRPGTGCGRARPARARRGGSGSCSTTGSGCPSRRAPGRTG